MHLRRNYCYQDLSAIQRTHTKKEITFLIQTKQILTIDLALKFDKKKKKKTTESCTLVVHPKVAQINQSLNQFAFEK